MSDTLINNPIYQILSQPSGSFVPFNDESIFGPGGQNAYNYICTKLKVTGDIRTMYYTSDYNQLNSWADEVEDLVQAGFPASQASNFTTSEYSLVLSTLEEELENASDVCSYFVDLKAVYLKCFTIEEAEFENLVKAVGLSDKPSQKVSGLISNVMIGMATTLGSDLIPGGSIFIGIMETTAEAYADANNILQGPQPPDSFNVAVTGLASHLIAQFLELDKNLDNMWERIVCDPGKMDQFSGLKGNPQGGIYWTPKDQEKFIDNATKAFQLEVLKLLLPISYAIYYGYYNTQFGVDNDTYYPDDINPVTWDHATVTLSANTPRLVVPYNGSNFQNSSNYSQGEKVYWIALRTDAEAFLDSSDIYNLINGLSECFLGLNGWNMVPTLYGWASALTVRVVNNTSNDITVEAKCWAGFSLIYEVKTANGKHTDATQTPVTLVVKSGQAVDFLGTANGKSSNAFSITLSGNGIGKQANAYTIVLPPEVAFSGQDVTVTPSANGGVLVNNQAIVTSAINNATTKGSHGGGCLFTVADAVLANGLKNGTTSN